MNRTRGKHRPAPGYGGRYLTPNAHRNLVQARQYLWHAWLSVRAAIRNQLGGF